MKRSEERLVSYLEKEKIDAFYVHHPVHVRYICKYSGGDAYLLILPQKFYLVTDPRCLEHAQDECPEYECIDWRPYGSIESCLTFLVEKERIHSMAVEEEHISCGMYETLQKQCGCTIVPTRNVIEDFQEVKEEEEISCIRIAAEIAQRALEKLYASVRPGVTEKELEAKLTMYMAIEGADVKAGFNTVLSGRRTTFNYGVPTMKAVEYGDLVWIQTACRYHGYLAEAGRTVVAGKASRLQKRRYEQVRQIHELAIHSIRCGEKITDFVRKLEREKDTMEDATYFLTGCGNGTGLSGGQRPHLYEGEDGMIEADTALTIETGISVPDWGGIHLADGVLVQKQKTADLVHLSWELPELF